MTIPDYQTVMLPFLKYTGDQKEHQLSEITESLATEFSLTPEEKALFLPGGTQRVFKSRVSWAGTYLKKAKLLQSFNKGTYLITEQGLALLAQNPSRIDNALLSQFPDFLSFINHREEDVQARLLLQAKEALDPFESLQENYQTHNHTLAEQLLETVKHSTSGFFEKLVVQLLLGMGYGGSHQDIMEAVTGRPGDQGIDGRIKQDPLGFEEIYIQAKRWNGTVGSPEVQQFAGSMDRFHARKGVLFTTSSFSKEAQAFITTIGKKIVLIDGTKLVELMIEHNVGVTSKVALTVKEVDAEFFE